MIVASKEQIKEYTEKGCWGSKTLMQDFYSHAARMPQRTAIVDPLNKEALVGEKPDRITYADLSRALDGTATSLAASGIGKDDIVLVQMPNCWELAMLYLAIAKTGAAISPVPMQWRSKELTYVAELTQAKAIITVDSFHGFEHLAMARDVQQKVGSIKHLFTYADIRRMIREKPDPRINDIPVDANDVFTICWTSGTEAQPKGCPLSHNNWRCQSSLACAAGVGAGDAQLTAGPMVNMASVGTVYVPWLLLGGTMVLHHPFDPVLLLKQMVEEKINYTLLVPAVVNLILKHPAAAGFDLGSVKYITVGSAPPSFWAMDEFKKRWNVDIGNIWGQNEGTAIISGVPDVPDMMRRVDQFPRYGAKGHTWSVPVTRFIETKVVDPSGNELTEADAVGELLYRGPNVIPGYFRRPDLSEKAFDSQGFFRTGDLFQIKGDRYLKFFDRAKDIIIRGGFNISAQEVENVVMAHPAVQDVAAVGMRDEDLGERTCVYVVPKPDQAVTLDDLVAFMKEKGVAVYKLPERLEIIATVPRNPVGKILKNQLRDDINKKLSGAVSIQ
ncbi:MAG TPA: class I adenylate-forming enzyme family protein [Desulfomonilaceae bacterium]|nr:class I adenylate-forming enzyme family protein [Desulfomonilaceae bacterium]